MSRFFTYFLFTGLGLILWQHRFGGADEARLEDPFAQGKLVLNLSNMVEQGGLSSKAVNQSLASPGEMILPAKTKLVALVDTHCAKQGLGGEYTRNAMTGETILDVQAFELNLPEDISIQSLSLGLNQDACIKGVTENIIFKAEGEFTNDPAFSLQTHMSTLRADLAYDFLWGSSLKIGQDVVIAVIDTGVDYTHPDLADNMWKSPSGHYGIDFVNSDMDPRDDDPNGHGTHVAGLAAAVSNNGSGISGVMGFRSKVMAIKSLDNERAGLLADVVNGIRYAILNGAQVINISLSGQGANAAIAQALVEAVSAGVFVVAAAGNDAVELSATKIFVPASYGGQIAGVLTVGSFDSTTLNRSSFSNFSTTFVELSAPGSQDGGTNGLVSTLPKTLYGRISGTSMSAPIAAGAAALVVGFLNTHGLPSQPADVESILRRSCVKSAALSAFVNEGNRLDLYQLSEYLQSNYAFGGVSGLESD